MYHDFFKLERMPFANTADPHFFFKTAEHEEALATLLYGVTQRRGIILVTGPPGSGKTLLAHMLVKGLRAQAQAALLLHTPETGHDLIASLCREFGVRHRASHPTGELAERLRSYLNDRFCEGKSVVSIIDEAQNMSPETLEHLRMLGNMEKESAKLLQIVLLGQPELVEKLKAPEMQQLCQRVFCHRQLQPLARDQTHHYLRHRLNVAGAENAEIFSEQAIDLIHDRSCGLPRLINQIADNAMLVAYSAGHREIGRDLVEGCIQDMMGLQLVASKPEPATAPTSPAVAASQPPASAWTATPPSEPAAPSQQALGESIRQGAEITGRLDEVNRSAQRQADDLKGLLAHAQSATTTLNHAQQASSSTRSRVIAHIREFRRLIKEAESTTRRLQVGRSETVELTSKLSTLVGEADACTRMLASTTPEARQALEEGIGRAQATVAEVTATLTKLSSAAQQADTTQAEIQTAVDQADGLRRALEAASSAVNDQTAEVRGLLSACEQRIDRVQELTPEADSAADRLDEVKRNAAEALATYDQQMAELAKRLERLPEQTTDLENTSERAEQLRQSLDASTNAAQTQLATSRELSSHVETEAQALELHLRDAKAACIQLTEVHGKLKRSFSTEAIRALQEAGAKTRSMLDEAATVDANGVKRIQELADGVRQVTERLGQLSELSQHADELRTSLGQQAETASRQTTELEERLDKHARGMGKQIVEAQDTITHLTELQDNLTERLDAQSETLHQQIDRAEAAKSQLNELRTELTESLAPKTWEDVGNASRAARADRSAARTGRRPVPGIAVGHAGRSGRRWAGHGHSRRTDRQAAREYNAGLAGNQRTGSRSP